MCCLCKCTNINNALDQKSCGQSFRSPIPQTKDKRELEEKLLRWEKSIKFIHNIVQIASLQSASLFLYCSCDQSFLSCLSLRVIRSISVHIVYLGVVWCLSTLTDMFLPKLKMSQTLLVLSQSALPLSFLLPYNVYFNSWVSHLYPCIFPTHFSSSSVTDLNSTQKSLFCMRWVELCW